MDNLPTGAIIATAELVESHTIFNTADNGIHVIHSTDRRVEWIYNNEQAFGWYEEGRYAWELGSARMLRSQSQPRGSKGSGIGRELLLISTMKKAEFQCRLLCLDRDKYAFIS